MKISELLKSILAEVPTGKRYRPIESWPGAEYLVLPNDIGLEPYCVGHNGAKMKCYWSRDHIAYHLQCGTIIEMV